MRVLCHWLGSLVGSWEGGCSGGGCGGGSGRADNFEWDGAVGSVMVVGAVFVTGIASC